MKRKNISVILLSLLVTFAIVAFASAASYDQVLQRWTKNRKFVDKDGANMEIKATYYAAEYLEATMQKEAQNNMWTAQELENYKYNYLGALQLNELIPIHIEFINNGPTMYLGPFDSMLRLRIGNQSYKPVDYDKRFNFRFQGQKDGLIFFARYDEKTGKDLLKGVKNVTLTINPAISPLTNGSETRFLWDVNNDNPDKLYQGTTANRFETDRLLKRLQKLRDDKAELEKQMKAVDDELGTIQTRLDELGKQ